MRIESYLRSSASIGGLLVFSAAHIHAQSALAIVNAADYVSQISPGSIATAFGTNLPTDSATQVQICPVSPLKSTCVFADIIAAAPTQISFLVPDPLVGSSAGIEVIHAGTTVASGSVAMTQLSPGIFTADNSGTGVFNGQAYDGGAYDPVFSPVAIDPSKPPGTSVFPRPVSPVSGNGPNILILYGTGWKHAAAANTQVTFNSNTNAAPAYVGPSSIPGLDQLNVAIPSGLAAATAQLVNLHVSFTGDNSNPSGAYRTRTVQFCLGGTDSTILSICAAPPTATPSCLEPLPNVPAPYAPHGLFIIEPQGVTPAVITTDILNQPAVCGADLYVVWNSIDSGNGVYNWTSLDNQIAPWAQAGKHVNLIVWGVSDNRPNNGTPNYVLNDPTYSSVTCQENGQTLTYPVYYTGAYKSDYKTFIQAVLSRYGANPNIGYIRFGLARGGEVFPTCLTQMMQFSGVTTLAQFNTIWENYISEMTDLQFNLNQQIIIANGRAAQLMTALDQYGSPVQYPVNDWEAQNAATLGMGFGMQGLSLAEISAFNANQLCTADWCKLFQSSNGFVPLELQTIAASDPTNAPGGTGSLTTLFPFGLNLHTQIFEVYASDFQIAYDPANASYTQYGPAYRNLFQQMAATLGFGGVK